jgi:hypothetical protein
VAPPAAARFGGGATPYICHSLYILSDRGIRNCVGARR